MIDYRHYKISLLFAAAAVLAACSSTPECPPPMEWNGTCTPAPKKATSRPYQIKGVWYYPQPHYEYEEEGIASYYGGSDVFHGRPTATGERFDMNDVSAAHKTVPLPCIAEVTNLENGRQIQLKINDRGPFIDGRIIDVSRRTAQLLGFDRKGTARVRVRTLVPESLALNGLEAPPVMVAQNTKSEAIPRLPDSFFEEASEVLAESPAIMEEAPRQIAASNSSGIFVDVGGFGSHAEAHAHSQRINVPNNLTIAPAQTNGSNPYTVRVGPLASMSQANQVLDQLTQAGHLMSRIIILR